MHLFFSQPTSPMARGHVSAIWDPGDPHQSPQTTIFTPETSTFSSQDIACWMWIMAPNPPNHQVTCVKLVPYCKMNCLNQVDRFSSVLFLIYFPTFSISGGFILNLFWIKFVSIPLVHHCLFY